MKCPRCQHDNPQGARFCEECATPLARACSNCGTALSATAKFCHACAHPVAAGAAEQPRSPNSYTPTHLAEKILTSKAALEGERKQVTVLFADLKGSMELLADRDPEEARKLLDPVLEHMMEAVHRYEGTVNQVMGDGIMALFGAPLAHEDHAVRACYAALRMRDSIRRYSEGLRRAEGVPIRIRVGLNSGEVVVRSIGSDLHMDYTAVGQTTHLAARMEQLAVPDTIAVTAATLALAGDFVEVKSLGPTPVKGLAEAVDVYEVTGAGLVRTRLQAAARRGLTRFVGRDAEVEQLRRVLGQAGAGHGQVVALVGEAGVGKSRLTSELTHSHQVQDWLVLEASSVSFGKATSYLPVIDLLKGYFKIGDRDDHRDMRAKVLGRVLALDRALEPLLPPLLGLLDVPVEDAAWQTLDSAQRRQRILDAVKRLLLRESQKQPLLVIFEDLHWVDTESQAFLDSLIESLLTARLVLLVNYRPEYRHGWSNKSYYTQLRLAALPHESAAELLLALLGADATVEALKPILIARTGGNPLFLEESVRALMETGALTGERGRYQLAQPLDTIDVPATVQVILTSRIDRLASEDKQLLQTASVIGKDVPFTLLIAIAGLPEEDLRRGLSHLQSAELLYETSLFPEPEYTFKHALTHETAYSSLLHEQRRTSHARIAEAIERLYPDRLTEHVERLAHHAVRGEVWAKAVTYLRRAGAKAQGRSAHQQGLSYLEQALQALRHLPETPEAREQEIDIRLELRGSLYPLGEFEKMMTYLREAEAMASARADDRRLGLIAIPTAEYFRQTGQFAEARTRAEQALALGDKLEDLPLRLYASHYLGLACHALGDYRHASELLRAAGVQSSSIDWQPGAISGMVIGSWEAFRAITLGWLARCLAEQGEFEEGVSVAHRAVALAEALGNPYVLTAACIGLGYISLARGDLNAAGSVLERACSLARDANLTLLRPQAGRLLGGVYLLAARIDEGVALILAAAHEVESRRLPMQQAAVLALLGEACLVASRLDEASTAGQRALNFARSKGQRGEEAVALRVLGEIAAHPDRFDAASSGVYYRAALALADELEMRPLVAHCHLGLGKLSRRTDKREQAHEHLATATMMYRQMGMTYWLERAQTELK